MQNIQITLADGSMYSKGFSTNDHLKSFLANLEIFEGLFFDLETKEKHIRINPRFIVKIEEEAYTLPTSGWE